MGSSGLHGGLGTWGLGLGLKGDIYTPTEWGLVTCLGEIHLRRFTLRAAWGLGTW